MLKAIQIRHLYCRPFVPAAIRYSKFIVSTRPTQVLQHHLCYSSASTAVDYSRIRIYDFNDIDRLYTLLTSYALNPSRADTVSEIVIDADLWANRSSWHHETEEMKSFKGNVKGHTALLDYVQNLAFDEDTTAKIIRSIDLKKKYMNGFWSPKDGSWPRENVQFAAVAITILLSLCHNVSTLYLAEHLSTKILVEFLLKNNYNQLQKPVLQKLKHVRFMTSSFSDPRVYGTLEILEYMQWIHRLPSLESVTMEGLQEYQAERTLFVPRTGNMKKMEISHCDISGPFLAGILSIPKTLQHLKLSLGGLWSTDGGLPLVRPFHVGLALAAYKDTLQVLDVDLDYVVQNADDRYWDCNEEDDGDGWMAETQKNDYGRDRLALDKATSMEPEPEERDVEEEYGRTIGSFHGFTRLTHLSVSIITLLGSWGNYERPFHLVQSPPFRLVDALPTSLEYLCIYGYVRGDNLDVDGHIDELLAEKEKKLPKLKIIEGIDKHIPSLKDIFGDLDEPAEDDVYVRKEIDMEWKEVEHDLK
ncbi:hypothetical protein FLONG3_5351 [Fusarium longipes]|uniref:Uncharacterized protein n=1 Tax=Fusarium longipes TaxID=694270 RepID=A0A395SWI4_9HYPO|nr:hypothetical protein FLONG3_5351 [Fusarium longipes]